MVMKTQVRIAELKSRLSEYLRRVRRGETITVLDRETPIARLEPVAGQGSRLVVREPGARAPRLRDLRLPPPLKTKADILDLLAEERGKR
jgi:prevent-host-death family protein